MIEDLVEFHPIIGTWDFNKKALEDDGDDEDKIAFQNTPTEDGEVVDVESDEVEMVDPGESTRKDVPEDMLQDAFPSSPPPSDFTGDDSIPPTSDASDEPEDDIVGKVEGAEGGLTLKRKCHDESDRVDLRWKVARREGSEMALDRRSGARTDDKGGSEVDTSEAESEAEIANKRKRGRSSAARRKLKEKMKSGGFVIDKQKKRKFEEKCTELDRGARFKYEGVAWQVLHSKCGNLYVMSEPYNTTKFQQHIGICKSRGGKGNLPITNFFKPKDAND